MVARLLATRKTQEEARVGIAREHIPGREFATIPVAILQLRQLTDSHCVALVHRFGRPASF